jgi:hypothetical protein
MTVAIQRLRAILNGKREIAIGFSVGCAAILMALALWPHSGVAGTLTWQNCPPGSPSGSSRCAIEPVLASVTVTAYPETWTTRSDAGGHFHLDLPPGGYSLTAEIKNSVIWKRGQTSFPVFANQITQVQLPLLPWFVDIKGGICLASGDRIATPTGPALVSQLHAGNMVWTLDGAGRRVAAPVLIVTHVPAPAGHHVLRVRLADGRVVEASAGHPTADGRQVGDLKPGDSLDNSRLVGVERISYVGDTWDLLPAGPSGAYWANDVLLGSTLWPGRLN